MNNRNRIKYFIASVVTVIAALVFIWTYINATLYLADSGSLETASVGSFGVQAEASSPSVDTKSVAISTFPEGVPKTNSASMIGTSTVKTVAIPVPIPPEYPSRLRIPSLNIDAYVQRVGVKKNGDLGSPNNFTDVGWYAAGTIPGQAGSAIIDGHVDNGLALAGVFKHLSDIAVGDNIYVTNRAGAVAHFIVTDIQSYDYQNAPVDLIFNQNNGSYLKLITCGGAWVPGNRTYDRRIVVSAVLSK